MLNWKVDRIFAIFAYCLHWLWPHMGHAVSKTDQNKCLDNEVFDLRETNWPRHHRIAGCWDGVKSDHRPNCPQMLRRNAWSNAELSTALWLFMEKNTSQKSYDDGRWVYVMQWFYQAVALFRINKHDYLVLLAPRTSSTRWYELQRKQMKQRRCQDTPFWNISRPSPHSSVRLSHKAWWVWVWCYEGLW